jgi:hypothetical protein
MLRVAADAWLTTQVADPELRLWLPPAQVRVVEPSLKMTVPLGVPPPGATTDTVAVYVTACPTTDGFVAELTEVVVATDAWTVTGALDALVADQPERTATTV